MSRGHLENSGAAGSQIQQDSDYWDGVVRSWGQSRRGEPSVTKHRHANLLQSVLPSMTATKPHVTLSPGKVAGAMEKLNFI